ncbi:MAG: T9SS type A sorting domain-containing protein [candidate division WOR-3 bacterium]|nr:T9SS type A sorting domain-containing protein [candidate division WOR-3 bacterium]
MKANIKATVFILILNCLATSINASKISLVKSQRLPIANQRTTINKLIRKDIRYKDNIVRNPQILDRIRTATKQNRTDTVKVLALRVEFVEDNTPLTTGNGKMDLAGFLSPDDGLFYDPPHTKRYFERLMQGLQKYYYLNSLGHLYVDYAVYPRGVFECYQLPHPMMYYGDTTSIEGIETGLCRLMYDALRIADQDPNLNFSLYDFIIIFHAGSGLQSDLRGDSPFDLLAGTIPSSALQTYLGIPYITVDNGHRIHQATIMPEMMRQDTMYNGEVNLLGMTGLLGTLCHEFVHLLGGYDLYDVTGYSMGVGAWSLMGFGAWLGDWSIGAPPGVIPGMLDPYHKIHLFGLEPLVINLPQESIPIFTATMDTTRFRIRGDTVSPLIIKIPISDNEYFLIENRQTDVKRKDTIVVDTEDGVVIWVEDGEYDFFLPGSGILIWHIDEQVIADFGQYNAINIFPAHKGVDLEEGDGIQDFDGWSQNANLDYQIYGSKYDPYFIGGFNSQFTPNTTPNSDGYYGKTHICVNVLNPPDTVMLISVDFQLYQKGFPKNLNRNSRMLSASCADLDQDGDWEVIVADSAGGIFTWQSDGTSHTTLTSGSFGQLYSSMSSPPAIGDVCDDNKLEVVCVDENGTVYIYPYDGLRPNTRINTNERILSSPVLADLDGNGKKEIILGTTNMNLHIWNGDGTPYPNFPKFLSSEIRSAVAITDTLNPQIVVLGSDNRLFLINSDGTYASGFPINLSHSPLYNLSPPVVGDIDRDGVKEIIAIATCENNCRLFVVDLNGTVKYSSPEIIHRPVLSAPALADIDNDGFLEVIIAGKNKIYAFNYNGTLQTNYPFAQDSTVTITQLLDGWLISYEIPFVFNSSPIPVDINNDSYLDFVIGSPKSGILGLDGRNGRMFNYFPVATVGSVSATPLVFDFDIDNDLEIAVGSDVGIFYVWDFPTLTHEIVWRQYLKDPAHTGLYSGLPHLPSPPEITVKNFYAYPNPADKEINIRYYLGPNPRKVKIALLDIRGQSKYEYNGSIHPLTDNEVKLNLEGIPSGVYLLRLEVESSAVAGSAVPAKPKKEIKFYKFAVVK